MSTTIDVYSEIKQLSQHIQALLSQQRSQTFTIQQSATALHNIDTLCTQLYELQQYIRLHTLNTHGQLPDTTTNTDTQDNNLQPTVMTRLTQYNKYNDSPYDRTAINSNATGQCMLYHRDIPIRVNLNKVSAIQIGKEYGYRLRELIKQHKSELLGLSNGALHDKLYELYDSEPKYSDLNKDNIYKPNKLINRALASEHIMYSEITHRSILMPQDKIEQYKIKKEQRRASYSSNRKRSLSADNSTDDEMNNVDTNNIDNTNNNTLNGTLPQLPTLPPAPQ